MHHAPKLTLSNMIHLPSPLNVKSWTLRQLKAVRSTSRSPYRAVLLSVVVPTLCAVAADYRFRATISSWKRIYSILTVLYVASALT